MSKPIQISDVQQQIFLFSKQLDQFEWELDDQLKDHPISAPVLSKITRAAMQCFLNYLATVFPKIQFGVDKDLYHANLHFLEKRERLAIRFLCLVPVEPAVVHQQFIESAQFKPQSSSTPVSEISHSMPLLLNRISSLLCQGNDSEALQVFDGLPAPLQKNVFDALHVVRGRPPLTDPIGHEKFGEVSFKGLEPRCASTPQQKACAIELVKLSSVFSDLIPLVGSSDLTQLRRSFELLPSHIQNEIFKKHWEQMGKPTSKSPNEFHRKIAHNDFGKVSFLGLEKRCDVAFAHKVKTLEAYLVDFNQKIATAQTLTDQIRVNWNNMDLEGVSAEKKADIKKRDLHRFVKEIVPLFEGPAPETHLLTDAPEESYHTLATAYVEKCSCLKPFFLQLMNKLVFKEDP